MQIDSLTVGIGFKVDYEKLDKLQARLKSINKLWEGITSKKLDSLEKGAVAAAKRADNEMAKIKRAAEAKNKQLRILADREEQAKEDAKKKRVALNNRGLRFLADLDEKRKEDADKARQKRVALNNRGLAFLADLDEKRKKEALKAEEEKEEAKKKRIEQNNRGLRFLADLEEKRKNEALKAEKIKEDEKKKREKEALKADAAKALDKAAKEKQEEETRKKRAAAAVQQMKDLRKGALITAAAVTAAYATFSKMVEHAKDSAQSMRNMMLTTGVDRTTLKYVGFSGEAFGLSEKEMFANVKAILGAQAALTMGGNAAPFASLGLSPTDTIEATIKKLRNASQKVDPNIFRQIAGQLGASDNFLAWITGGKDLELPKAFSLSVDEYNQTLRAAEAWNKLLYLMGQFGDKLMSKSGDKLVTVFTAIINMMDTMLRLIDEMDANPVLRRFYSVDGAINALLDNWPSVTFGLMEYVNTLNAGAENPTTSSASIIGQIGEAAIDKSTQNTATVTNSGGNSFNNRIEIYDGAGAARVIDYLELQQSGYQIPYQSH